MAKELLEQSKQHTRTTLNIPEDWLKKKEAPRPGFREWSEAQKPKPLTPQEEFQQKILRQAAEARGQVLDEERESFIRNTVESYQRGHLDKIMGELLADANDKDENAFRVIAQKYDEYQKELAKDPIEASSKVGDWWYSLSTSMGGGWLESILKQIAIEAGSMIATAAVVNLPDPTDVASGPATYMASRRGLSSLFRGVRAMRGAKKYKDAAQLMRKFRGTQRMITKGNPLAKGLSIGLKGKQGKKAFQVVKRIQGLQKGAEIGSVISTFAKSAEGRMANEMMKKDVDPEVRKWTAKVGGILYAGVEALGGLDRAVPLYKPVHRLLQKKMVDGALKAFSTVAMDVGKAALMESLEEAVQSGVMDGTVNAGVLKTFMDESEKNISESLDDPELELITGGTIMKNAWTDFKGSLGPMMMASMIQAAPGAIVETRDARKRKSARKLRTEAIKAGKWSEEDEQRFKETVGEEKPEEETPKARPEEAEPVVSEDVSAPIKDLETDTKEVIAQSEKVSKDRQQALEADLRNAQGAQEELDAEKAKEKPGPQKLKKLTVRAQSAEALEEATPVEDIDTVETSIRAYREGEGWVATEDTRKLTDGEKKVYKLIDSFTRAIDGKPTVLLENFNLANGMRTHNAIYLDVTSPQKWSLDTAGHETIGHSTYQWAKKESQYSNNKEPMKVIKEVISWAEKTKEYKKEIEAIRRSYTSQETLDKGDLTLGKAGAQEEFIADIFGKLMSDPEFFNKLNEEQPKLIDRILQAFKDFFNKAIEFTTEIKKTYDRKELSEAGAITDEQYNTIFDGKYEQVKKKLTDLAKERLQQKATTSRERAEYKKAEEDIGTLWSRKDETQQFGGRAGPQLGKGSYWSSSELQAMRYSRGEGALGLGGEEERSGVPQVVARDIRSDAKLFPVNDTVNAALHQRLMKNEKFAKEWQADWSAAKPTNKNLWDAARAAGIDLQGVLQKEGYLGAWHPNYKTKDQPKGSRDVAVWDESALTERGQGALTVYRGERKAEEQEPDIKLSLKRFADKQKKAGLEPFSENDIERLENVISKSQIRKKFIPVLEKALNGEKLLRTETQLIESVIKKFGKEKFPEDWKKVYTQKKLKKVETAKKPPKVVKPKPKPKPKERTRTVVVPGKDALVKRVKKLTPAEARERGATPAKFRITTLKTKGKSGELVEVKVMLDKDNSSDRKLLIKNKKGEVETVNRSDYLVPGSIEDQRAIIKKEGKNDSVIDPEVRYIRGRPQAAGGGRRGRGYVYLKVKDVMYHGDGTISATPLETAHNLTKGQRVGKLNQSRWYPVKGEPKKITQATVSSNVKWKYDVRGRVFNSAVKTITDYLHLDISESRIEEITDNIIEGQMATLDRDENLIRDLKADHANILKERFEINEEIVDGKKMYWTENRRLLNDTELARVKKGERVHLVWDAMIYRAMLAYEYKYRASIIREAMKDRLHVSSKLAEDVGADTAQHDSLDAEEIKATLLSLGEEALTGILQKLKEGGIESDMLLQRVVSQLNDSSGTQIWELNEKGEGIKKLPTELMEPFKEALSGLIEGGQIKMSRKRRTLDSREYLSTTDEAIHKNAMNYLGFDHDTLERMKPDKQKDLLLGGYTQIKSHFEGIRKRKNTQSRAHIARAANFLIVEMRMRDMLGEEATALTPIAETGYSEAGLMLREAQKRAEEDNMRLMHLIEMASRKRPSETGYSKKEAAVEIENHMDKMLTKVLKKQNKGITTERLTDELLTLKEAIFSDLGEPYDFNRGDPRGAERISEYMRAVSIVTASWGDKGVEYYKNSLLASVKTIAQNPISNYARTVYEFVLKRPLIKGFTENKGFGFDVRAYREQFRASKIATRGYLPFIGGYSQKKALEAFGQSWNTEMPTITSMEGGFAMGSMLGPKAETRRHHAIGKGNVKGISNLGRLIRMPFRAIQGFDEFGKVLIARALLAEQYIEQARRDGKALNEATLEQDIDKWMEKGGIEVERAKALAVEFMWQNRPGKIGEAGWKIRSAMGRTGEFVLPFVTTPVNILSAGMRMSPLGALSLAHKGIQYKMVQRNKKKFRATLKNMSTQAINKEMDQWSKQNIGNRRWWEEATGRFNPEVVANDIIEQAFAWSAMVALASWAFPDDDDDRFAMSGNRPSYLYDRNKGKFKREQLLPPRHIKMWGFAFDYGRIEPFATATSALIDLLHAHREAKEGRDKSKAFMDAFVTTAMAVQDQTYLSQLRDITSAALNVNDPSKALKEATSFATGFVPAIFRTTIDATDKWERDTSIKGKTLSGRWFVNILKSGATRVVPAPIKNFAPPPKVDIWGDDISKLRQDFHPLTDFFIRLIPEQVGIDIKFDKNDRKGQLNRMIANWNSRERFAKKNRRKNGKAAASVWPAVARNSIYIKSSKLGKQTRWYLTNSQYQEYQKLIGKISFSIAKNARFNIDNPRIRDMLRFKDIRKRAADIARKRMKRKYRREIYKELNK